jgi:hypothetical protein
MVGKPGAAALFASCGTRAPSFAAVSTQKGGQDHFGPYELVANGRKPLSQLRDTK